MGWWKQRRGDGRVKWLADERIKSADGNRFFYIERLRALETLQPTPKQITNQSNYAVRKTTLAAT